MKTFALFAIDRSNRSHLVCVVPGKDIAAAADTLGGTMKDVMPSTERNWYRMCFPGRQICGVFVPGNETPERLATIEHPDAPSDVMTALVESHRWTTDGNCYKEFLLGSVPAANLCRGRPA